MLTEMIAFNNAPFQTRTSELEKELHEIASVAREWDCLSVQISQPTRTRLLQAEGGFGIH